MDLKKIGKALLFPHIALMIILVPVASAFLICSMVFIGTESLISILSYVFAAYTLTVWCFKIPHLIKHIRDFKNNNRYASAHSIASGVVGLCASILIAQPFSLGVKSGLMYLLEHVLEINIALADICIEFVIFIFNFTVQKLFIFKDKK